MDTLRWTLLLLGVLVLGGIWLWGRWRRRHGDDLDDLLDDTDWMEQVARRTREQRGEPEADPEPEALNEAFEAALHRDAPQEPARARAERPEPERIRTEPPASREVAAGRGGEGVAARVRGVFEAVAPTDEADEEADASARPARAEPEPPEPAPAPETETAPEPESAPGAETASQRSERAEGVVRPPGEDDLILALFVMAPEGAVFPGDALGEALRDAGLQFGDMDIYHWFQQVEAGPPEAVFSVASMVEPGTLERTGDPDFHTPGLALFLRLPGPAPGGEAFEAMLATGRRLADGLGGELKDERRSTLTQQTIGHIRDRVREHSLRQHAGRG